MSLKKCHALVISALIAATVIALGLMIYYTRQNSSAIESLEESLSFPPSLRPSFFPLLSQRSLSIRNKIEKNVLQRNVTFDEIEATDSRVLSLNCITDKDQAKLLETDTNLFQRYILVLLAFDFSNPGWLSFSNECNWVGVECNIHGHVVKLESSE